MDGRVTASTFGAPELLQFQLEWSALEPKGTAADATRGRLAVRLGNRNVWGTPQGFEWTWVELVEHLARFWVHILIEEGDPLGLGGGPLERNARGDSGTRGGASLGLSRGP